MRPALILVYGCLILAGCDSASFTADKSYPAALDLPEVTVHEAAHPENVPTEVNVRAYVVDLFSCAPGYKCVVEDHIWIAPSLTGSKTADAIYIGVHAARQFREGHGYLFSLRATAHMRSDSVEVLRFTLLGYDAP